MRNRQTPVDGQTVRAEAAAYVESGYGAVLEHFPQPCCFELPAPT